MLNSSAQKRVEMKRTPAEVRSRYVYLSAEAQTEAILRFIPGISSNINRSAGAIGRLLRLSVAPPPPRDPDS